LPCPSLKQTLRKCTLIVIPPRRAPLKSSERPARKSMRAFLGFISVLKFQAEVPSPESAGVNCFRCVATDMAASVAARRLSVPLLPRRLLFASPVRRVSPGSQNALSSFQAPGFTGAGQRFHCSPEARNGRWNYRHLPRLVEAALSPSISCLQQRSTGPREALKLWKNREQWVARGGAGLDRPGGRSQVGAAWARATGPSSLSQLRRPVASRFGRSFGPKRQGPRRTRCESNFGAPARDFHMFLSQIR